MILHTAADYTSPGRVNFQGFPAGVRYKTRPPNIFCLESVPARVVGLTELDGVPLSPWDPVWPCAGSLCMGFTWSLFFAQRANEYKVSGCPLLANARLVTDRGEPMVIRLSDSKDRTRWVIVYVDNFKPAGPAIHMKGL